MSWPELHSAYLSYNAIQDLDPAFVSFLACHRDYVFVMFILYVVLFTISRLYLLHVVYHYLMSIFHYVYN